MPSRMHACTARQWLLAIEQSLPCTHESGFLWTQGLSMQLETKLALAMFVGRFHVRMAPHMAISNVTELADNTTSLLTLRQKRPIWLTLQPRASSPCS